MPGIKDGPRNLKQMGAGRGPSSSGGGRSAPSGGGPGQYPRMPRGAKRSSVRNMRKVEKRPSSYRGSSRPSRAGQKQTLTWPGTTGNRAAKGDLKAGNTAMRGFVSRSVSPRMSKAPVKPSKSVAKRQAKFK